MSEIEKRTFDLPADQSAFVDAQVSSDAFASASDVVSEGLRALQERDEKIDCWLRDEVGPTYDEMRAHPEQGISGEQWLDGIRKIHAERVKALD